MTTFIVLVDIKNIDLFWTASVSAALLAGGTASFYMAALNRFAAASPEPIYLSGVYAGQGAAGAVIAFASFLTIAAGPLAPEFCEHEGPANESNGRVVRNSLRLSLKDEECDPFRVDWSAFAYFAFVSVTLGLCICGFLRLKQSQQGRKRLRGRGSDGSFGCDSLGLADEGNGRDSMQALIEGHVDDISMRRGDGETNGSGGVVEIESYRVGTVIAETKATLVGIFLVFAVTLAVFPSFTAISTSQFKCQPSASRAANDLFVPLLFLAFNMFDLFGRLVAGVYPSENAGRLFWLASLRVLMIPFFFMTRVNGESEAWLSWDGFPFVLMILLGGTNGYLATCIMVVGPRTLPNGNGRDLASTLHLFALTIGLLAGATLSLGLIKLV